MYLSYICIAYRIFVYLKVYLHSILKKFSDFLVLKMGMLKLVDRSRLGRGEIIHISSSLITHKYNSNVLFYKIYIF
jgi:hypothetical protein